MKLKNYCLLIILLLSGFLLSGCSRNPVTGQNSLNFYSEADEVKIGEESHPEIISQYGEYQDEKLKNYVQGIVNRLGDISDRPNLQYPVTILDTPEVNAFALPGGHVYVCRGILRYFNSESELAGVMAHEIGHVCARHGVEQLSLNQGLDLSLLLGSWFLGGQDKQKAQDIYNLGSTVSVLGRLSYSRENEMQSDRLGIEYTYKAGYSPLGLSRVMVLFQRMSAGSESNPLLTVLSTHPASDIRAKQARIEIRKLEEQGDINRDLGRERYLGNIANIITGYNPARGTILDQVYYNTTVLLRCAVPGGFTCYPEVAGYLFALQNSAQTAAVYLSLQKPEDSAEDTQRMLLEKQLNAKPASVSLRTWNGNNSYAYFYLLQSQDNAYLQITFMMLRNNDKVLQLIVKETRTAAVLDPSLLDTFLAKLQPLSQNEAVALKPDLLQIYVTQKTDTWKSLTDKYYPGADPKRLAWLNDCELADPLPDKIKLGLF